ncbi:hypothetical protein SEA_BOOSTSEASON_87 [Mycobacterium phage BoostSeason]|uniref:Uncharacterized protein n=1 Tax=Mycobacterium phage Mufasa TaxID=1718600 RepID=A0A0M3UKB9_9CAUD|nr:hypothetical protein SEA_MUFASA_87 [Mycobacterium phage Mufasa]ALF00521.1 hypothetical protein SEA_MUFASA_87 [Mycobacterium phage Mufasa]AYN57260.1 hypothetical protein SEA_BOOSTSEASON_87 [Mycobacterium phage BoostSeason]
MADASQLVPLEHNFDAQARDLLTPEVMRDLSMALQTLFSQRMMGFLASLDIPGATADQQNLRYGAAPA